MSPFSTLQNYTLITYPYTPRVPGNLTPWEQEKLEFLSQVGAAAYFQITYKSKQKQKLNTLHRAGLLRKYKLEGETPMLVAALKSSYEIHDLLKSLAFTQLVLRLKERFNLEILPGDDLLHAVIQMNNKYFPVIVLRASDDILIPNINRLIIVSETFRPEFNKIKTPVRIALDEDLLSSPLTFYLPDGQKEVL